MPATQTITKSKGSTVNQPSVFLLSPQTETHTRLSPSCQQIVSETFSDNIASITIRSCIADSGLYPVITGHLCNKVPLVPSSLWADMALTTGAYIWKTLCPGTEPTGLNISDMEVPKPLIAQVPQRHPGQYVEIQVEARLDDSNGGIADCFFRSVQPDGTKLQDHATCHIRFESREAWKEEWSRVDYMVQNAIVSLVQQDNMNGSAHCMQRGLAYKLFSSFVTYSSSYQGMSEVVFNGLEGTAKIDFQTRKGDYCAPFHLDNSCHVSGFLSNSSDLESEDSVFISEGWNGLRIMDVEDLLHTPGESMKGQIRTYARMLPKPGNVQQGDVYVFKDNDLVAVWEGVKFKRLPKKVLNIFLPAPKNT